VDDEMCLRGPRRERTLRREQAGASKDFFLTGLRITPSLFASPIHTHALSKKRVFQNPGGGQWVNRGAVAPFSTAWDPCINDSFFAPRMVLRIRTNQAKRHMRTCNGIPKNHFNLFLKEWEWRFSESTPKNLLIDLKRITIYAFNFKQQVFSKPR
jgi:hypothetical protein